MSRAGEPTDLCVLGASEAGLAACAGAAALGLTVTLIDDGDPDGRRNPDLLLEALRQVALAGASGSRPEPWREIRGALSRAAAERRHARFAAMNVRVVAAHGRFADRDTLVADGVAIRARRIILAVGGRQPSYGLAAPLGATRCLAVQDLADLESVPSSVIILGGGPQAVAAAQALRRLGARTTLMADHLLPGFDDELAAPLLAALARDAVRVLAGTRVQLVRPAGDGVVVVLMSGALIEASRLVLAEEAEPALDGLDLSRAGIESRDGRLVLDPRWRTTNPRVYAAGRVAGAATSAEGVARVGRLLRTAFLPLPGRVRPGSVATVTATDPQVATVGLSEEAAAQAGPVRVWRWPLAQTGAGLLAGPTSDFVKVVTNRRGEIVGAGLVGRDVRDLVGFWSLAISQRLTITRLADVAVPSPSFTESARALALTGVAQRLGHPAVARALRFARWLG